MAARTNATADPDNGVYENYHAYDPVEHDRNAGQREQRSAADFSKRRNLKAYPRQCVIVGFVIIILLIIGILVGLIVVGVMLSNKIKQERSNLNDLFRDLDEQLQLHEKERKAVEEKTNDRLLDLEIDMNLSKGEMKTFQDKIWKRVIHLEGDDTLWYLAKNGLRYKRFGLKSNYEEAKEICQQVGRRLASRGIRDKVTVSELKKENVITTLEAWIGLRRKDSDSDWAWIDGGSYDQNSTMWKSGQPNDDGDCALADYTSEGEILWDRACNTKQSFICER